MDLLGIEFYFKIIANRYSARVTLHSVIVLMNRCRRLYSAISHLAAIFRLLRNKITDTKRDPNFLERLRCSIRSFFCEHTLLPLKFVFGGRNVL